MPRVPRIDYPGARHHVMNRGARRAAIFGEAWAAALFLEVLAELPGRFGVRVLAYAIMPNHYHLLLESPTGDLSRAMKYLGAEFTQRMNRRLQWDGPVFRGRFKSRIVEDEGYLAHLFAYIHLNPVKAALAQSADAAQWTSHRALVGLEPAPVWLATPAFLGSFGSIEQYRAYLEECLAGRAVQPSDWRPEHLWIAGEPRPAAQPLVAAEPDIRPLLAVVSRVSGASEPELLRAVRGRTGNPARCLAAWWIARQTRLANAAVGALLGCSAPRISQMRAAVERGDPVVLAGWRTALESEAGPAPTLFVSEPPPVAYSTGTWDGSGRSRSHSRPIISFPPCRRPPAPPNASPTCT